MLILCCDTKTVAVLSQVYFLWGCSAFDKVDALDKVDGKADTCVNFFSFLGVSCFYTRLSHLDKKFNWNSIMETAMTQRWPLFT